MRLLGGIALDVDGAPVNVAERFIYKGMMLSDVPNLALSFGYTNASWTLKCDLTARYVCRLLKPHGPPRLRDLRAARLATPRPSAAPMLDFSSGYVRRAEGSLPAQGAEGAVAGPPELFRDSGAALRDADRPAISFRHPAKPGLVTRTRPPVAGRSASRSGGRRGRRREPVDSGRRARHLTFT